MTTPLVSVLLPLYNGAAHVGRALDSILTQTFADFEVIVVDDGSVDDGGAIVAAVNDPRIRLVRQENRGLASTLNHAISLARGQFLARQDHDDLSRPDRFAKQLAFLEANPDVALLGTRAEIWVGEQPDGRTHDHPTADAALRFELLFDNPFVHSSVMMRAEAVRQVGGYTTDPAQDYDLWSRLSRRHRVANLDARLVIYREFPQSISRSTNQRFRQERIVGICAGNLAAASGRNSQDPVVINVAALHHGALHLCNPSISLLRMEALIREAAASILADAPDSDVAARRDRVLWNQRRRWLQFKYPWCNPMFGIARRVVALARR